LILLFKRERIFSVERVNLELKIVKCYYIYLYVILEMLRYFMVISFGEWACL